jgi:chemotaxis protein methyltransferase CheR
MVTFSCNSLTEDNHLSAFGSPDTMDIIFCRNVLMYFTNEWAVKISRDLVNSISEKGWLIVSSCELSQQLFPKLTPVNFPGAIIYQKTRDRYSCPAPSGAITEKEFQFSSTFSSILPLTHSPAQHLNLLQPLNTSTLQPINLSTIQQTPSITEESFTSEINTIRLLAGKGQLKEALSACDKALVSFKLAPRLYFVRASILQELNKSHEAIKSLKQAIYVDPDYIMGHFTLGNLFIRQGNSKNAKRHFSNVLDLLSRYANDEILPDSEGLSAKYIKEIIITSMKTLELR